ncbi:MAG: DUF6702 family protein [Candidatus Arcticimaribacter sp.]
MKSKLILILFVFLCSFTITHDYYLSTTNIKWVPAKQQVQLTSRFFLEDIEALMQKETGQKVVFSPDSNLAEIDAFVKDFYLSNLAITIDGEQQEIAYLGREYKDDDLLVVYAEVVFPAKEFKTLDVKASFLIDFLTGQQNIVHLITPNQKKSFLLTNKKAALDFTL